jgi:hypothetical protein
MDLAVQITAYPPVEHSPAGNGTMPWFPASSDAMPLLYSLIESPSHPDASGLYRQLGLEHLPLTSARKAIAELKKRPPDYVVAEFFYGYGNNYAGVNVSNLDVFLHSARKYAPGAKIIVMVSKTDAPHVDKLKALFDIQAVLVHPFSPRQLAEALIEAGVQPPV